MKIGVISDTHDHMEFIKKFTDRFMQEKVDMVFHCGDIVAPFAWLAFKGLRESNIPFFAVYGNNDGDRAALNKIFGKVCKIEDDFLEKEVGGKKIIMFHHLSPDMVEAIAKSGQYDLLLKGHTHEVKNEMIGDTLVLNPGEACGYLTGEPTAAIVDLESMKAEVIKLENVKTKKWLKRPSI